MLSVVAACRGQDHSWVIDPCEPAAVDGGNFIPEFLSLMTCQVQLIALPYCATALAVQIAMCAAQKCLCGWLARVLPGLAREESEAPHLLVQPQPANMIPATHTQFFFCCEPAVILAAWFEPCDKILV